MPQRGSIGPQLALDAVEPQHGLALAFRDRLPVLSAIDIFPSGIDRLRTELSLLPIMLKGPPALVLRLVDLAMGVQPRQRIVADRAQRDDLVARLQPERIV